MPAVATWTFMPVGDQFTLVDAEDYERFSGVPWRILRTNGGPYVQEGGKVKDYLHRRILGLKKGSPLRADHINGDTLDNRRCNLRAVTNSENLQNRHGLNANNKTGYRGVSLDAQTNRYRASVWVDGRNRSLGRFDTAEEAAEVASEFRREHMPLSEMDQR